MMMQLQRTLRTATVSRASYKRSKRGWHRPAALLCCAGLAAAIASPHDALAYTVTLNTASLAGASGRLEFDLLDLDPAANNSVVISGIVGNGIFVGTECSVGCTGGPSSFVLNDTGGFGQLLYDLTLGTSLSFDLSFTTNYGGVPGTDPPDRFALSLLDSGTDFTLVDTDLSFPDDALLAIDLIGAGVVQTAAFTNPNVGLAIPEPGSLALAATALLALARRRASTALRAFFFA
jgi:hypothetical protein